MNVAVREEIEVQPEADETLCSGKFLGVVLGRTIQIVQYKHRLGSEELRKIIGGPSKTTFYRWRSGRPMKKWDFDAVMHQLELIHGLVKV